MKKYILIAGVNGAGKSTLFSSETFFNDFEKINLDEVVRKIGNWQNEADVIKAGKIVVEKIEYYFSNGISFTQETTLCGRSILKNIKRAIELGYAIEMYYVGLESPDIAKERIRIRVSHGGHGISDEDVERRYVESMRRMKEVIQLCDKALIYDNTESFRRIAVYRKGKCERRAEELPKWYVGNM